MQPALRIQGAAAASTELNIHDGEQVLGRAADADLRLDGTFVSTHHARLNWHNGTLSVLDLNSTNGTSINGVPVVGWTTLADGDVIEFGGVEAVVAIPDRAPGVDRPSTTNRRPPPPEGRIPTDRTPIDTLSAGGPLPPERRAVTLPPTPPAGITIRGLAGPELDAEPARHPESTRFRGRDRGRPTTGTRAVRRPEAAGRRRINPLGVVTMLALLAAVAIVVILIL